MSNSATTITVELCNQLLEQARKSKRKRVMHLFHEAEWEHMHRMLNALAKGTYITPHRHNDKHNAEGFIVLLGKVAVIIFTEKGELDVAQSAILEPNTNNIGIDVKPNTWHSVVALEDSVTKRRQKNKRVEKKNKVLCIEFLHSKIFGVYQRQPF